MPGYRAEFTIEPFAEGHPGPAVVAGIEAVRDNGLEPSMEAFSTVVEGDSAAIIAAISDMVSEAMHAGATRITLQVERGDDR